MNDAATILTEETVISVIAYNVDPELYFSAEENKEISTIGLLGLVVASPKSFDKYVVSAVTKAEEAFFGCNNSAYLKEDFEYVSPSLSFEEIFRIFPSDKKAKKFVDDLAEDSTAEFWMLYRLSFDDKKNLLSLIPQGRFKRENRKQKKGA